MNAKIVSLAIMISVSSAVLIDPSESASKAYSTGVSNGWQYFKQYQPPSYDTHAYPKYEFEYAVSDKITGDHKHQHETRDGNRVHGEYSLIEADGSLRRVQYNADHYNGFHAIVSTSVQKHGDGAISTFGHTRQFLPIGHGVKINHFFPKKDYTPPKDIHLDANLTRKPIKEIMEETFQNKNSSEISLDTESITIQPKYEDSSTKLTTDNDIPILKMETIEGPLMEIMPTEIPSTTDYITTENSTDNNHLSEISENNDGNSIRENNTSDEHQHLSKLNHSSDSEVASSYFSRIYYVGF